MSGLAAKLAVGLLGICLAIPAGAAAASGELTPVGGSAWQAEPEFEIEWDPIAPPEPRRAVYRIYDSRLRPRIDHSRPLADLLTTVRVPETPDAYLLEAWLENGSGGEGPHSMTVLRFDDSAPPPPRVDPLPPWVPGIDPVVVRAGRSPDPPTPSGTRGFAVSADRGGGSMPCARLDRCLASELDLADGEGGTVSLGTLPEGLNFVRVVAVSGSGVPSPATTTAVRVDGSAPVPSLDGRPAGWSNRPVPVTAKARDALSGMAARGPGGPFTAIAVDGAAPTRAPGDSVEAWVAGSGIHVVEYFARDAVGNLGRGGGPVAIRIDEDAPSVAFAAAQDPTEPERVEATVSDGLSGPSSHRGWIGIRLRGTRASFKPLPTRNAGNRLVARWDSDADPPGTYELVAVGYDAAGNSATGSSRSRGARMVLVNPLKAQAELAAGISRRRFAGRLRRAGGGPLAGREVLVTETFRPGSVPRQRTTAVETGRTGAFSLRLGPGPSREIVARFDGSGLLSRAASPRTRLDVSTGVRLRASAASARIGGEPIVFSGEVRHRGAATVAGLPVELQFRFRGDGWRGFRTVETDRRGRFRYRYRFSDDDSRGVRFQFRAYVKGREGWPYGPGTSRPVLVRGI